MIVWPPDFPVWGGPWPLGPPPWVRHCLHVIHGSFRTGVQKTGWKIGDLLKSLGYLFSDSPVRRKNFMEITQCSKFDIMLDNMQIRTLV